MSNRYHSSILCARCLACFLFLLYLLRFFHAVVIVPLCSDLLSSVLSCPILSCPIPSHPIPSHPIPSPPLLPKYPSTPLPLYPASTPALIPTSLPSRQTNPPRQTNLRGRRITERGAVQLLVHPSIRPTVHPSIHPSVPLSHCPATAALHRRREENR
jgi:hypothetical protein